MDVVLWSGVGLFALGLVLSHVVVAMTRKPVREGQGLSRRHRVLMWCSLGLVATGVVVGAIGYFGPFG